MLGTTSKADLPLSFNLYEMYDSMTLWIHAIRSRLAGQTPIVIYDVRLNYISPHSHYGWTPGTRRINQSQPSKKI